MIMFRKFDARLDRVLSRRFHRMMSWKVFTNWENVSLRSPKIVLELYDMEIHQKLRLRNFDARNERIESGAVVTIRKGQRGVGRGQGECHQWKTKRTVFERRHADTEACKTRHQKPLNPMSHQHTEVEVRRGKKTQSVESTWEVRSTVVQRPLEMYLHQITFVIFGILLKFNSINHSRNVNSVMCSFAQAGWRSTWQKNRKRMVTNVQWLYRKLHDGWVAYFRTQSRRNLHRFYGRTQQSWDQFDECDPQSFTASCKHPRKQMSAARNIQLKIPHQRSL